MIVKSIPGGGGQGAGGGGYCLYQSGRGMPHMPQRAVGETGIIPYIFKSHYKRNIKYLYIHVYIKIIGRYMLLFLTIHDNKLYLFLQSRHSTSLTSQVITWVTL